MALIARTGDFRGANAINGPHDKNPLFALTTFVLAVVNSPDAPSMMKHKRKMQY